MEFLETSLRGKKLYIMREHRTALLCWKRAFKEQRIVRNSLLVHIDAHSDLYSDDTHIMDARRLPGMEEKEAGRFVNSLRYDNSEFVIPAMHAQLVKDAICIGWRHGKDAGTHIRKGEGITEHMVIMADGVEHRAYYCPTQNLSSLFSFYSYLGLNTQHEDVAKAYETANPMILDIDLDFFTYKNEQIYAKNTADIREQLTSNAFKRLLDRAAIITIALEPECCGGKEQCMEIARVLNECVFIPNGLDALSAIEELLTKAQWKAVDSAVRGMEH